MSAVLTAVAPQRIRVRPTLRVGRWSVRISPVPIAVALGLSALVVVLFGFEIALGDFDLSLGQVVDVLTGGGTRAQRFVVHDLRLPRALLCLAIGVALAVAGALTQSISRNALASPDILGITAGASAAAVALLALGPTMSLGLLDRLGVPLSALLGAFVTAAVIFGLSYRGGITGYRLILVGIGVNAVLVAVTGWMLTNADINNVSRAQVWLNGSVGQANWNSVPVVLVSVAVLVTLAIIGSFTLGALRLGDDTAAALGINVQRAQAILLLLAVGLAAAATAAAGPVGFVALAAPQIAIRLTRSAGPPIVVSGLVGAVLVLAADLIARVVLPVELPVGLVTSALGGPFLLYLLVRANRKVTA